MNDVDLNPVRILLHRPLLQFGVVGFDALLGFGAVGMVRKTDRVPSSVLTDTRYSAVVVFIRRCWSSVRVGWRLMRPSFNRLSQTSQKTANFSVRVSSYSWSVFARTDGFENVCFEHEVGSLDYSVIIQTPWQPVVVLGHLLNCHTSILSFCLCKVFCLFLNTNKVSVCFLTCNTSCT